MPRAVGGADMVAPSLDSTVLLFSFDRGASDLERTSLDETLRGAAARRGWWTGRV